MGNVSLSPRRPLDGLKVLDFTHALAGPYCTMLMAAYGADVYKIEDTGPGDMGRTWGPPFVGGEASYFLGLNSGKKGLSIDLKDPRGHGVCVELLRRADILIENFRPGTMARLGLDYETARTLNPRLVYCSISGYGQTGPGRDDSAMDLIMQAACGLLSATGAADGSIARCGHSVADITAGMFALSGVLMALRVREQTGGGQYVDISMLDSMISAMASNFAYCLGSGQDPKPMGTAFATIVPYACFPAQDGQIAIAVANERLWRAFGEATGRLDVIGDARFETNALRVENRRVLEALVSEILGGRTVADWCERFRKFGIPCAPVRTLSQVASDPQAQARAMFPVVTHPQAGPVRVTGAPVKLSETPGAVGPASPAQGQHTREVLRELLEMDEESINALAAAHVIREGTAERESRQ
jgi:crotonobetainyl-CoA:carnitine CoA-transferase CaiB-like acyl-CoA transferase